MEKSENSVVKPRMSTLREGIKNKYKAYHLADRNRFPDFEYNTNRANYESLRASFEEEFYVVRGIDRTKNNLHIPSTNTLALLFCDDSYVPSKKILDTCTSYAEGKAQVIVNEAVAATAQPTIPAPFRMSRKLWAALLVALTGLVIYVAILSLRTTPPASGLVIEHPSNGRIVPMELFAEGRVVNASTVWIVVRAVGGLRYWVQPPIKVETDSTWRGVIYIGSNTKDHIGFKAQIRAFANPVNALSEGEELFAWPEAETSSAVVDVIRGAGKD